MIWGKVIGAGAILFASVGVGWWLVSTIQENERLALNNATLEQARAQDAEVMAFLRKDIEAKERAAIIRTEKIVDMGRKLEAARREVRTITREVVTEVDRNCLLSPVPDPIVEFMLDEGTVDPNEGDR